MRRYWGKEEEEEEEKEEEEEEGDLEEQKIGEKMMGEVEGMTTDNS